MKPLVSIIVPCYNEEATIHLLLEAIYQQTYPLQRIEVIIADGLSSDGTRQVIRSFQDEYADIAVQIVDNPKRNIPSGLNQAIEAASGTIIVRLDGHSSPACDYVERCVKALEEERGDNVGGIWRIRAGGDGILADAIALAASHPLAAGDARYRIGGKAQQVDTVPFGAFRREVINRIGKFDESLLTNEDYEFNVRLRQSGGKVWFDPAIQSVYYARPDLASLARQYWRYGYWKMHMLRRHPGSLRWRQALPPLFVMVLLGLAFLSLWGMIPRLLLVAQLSLYIIVLIIAGIQIAWKKRRLGLVWSLPLAIATMQLSWGSAFLWGLARSLVGHFFSPKARHATD